VKRSFPRDLEQLGALVDFTADFFDAEDIDPRLRNGVDLCIEELFVNMVTYNRETQSDILVELEPRRRGVRLSLTDFDVDRFDPRAGPPADVTSPAEERMPGGLGLYLVMKMANAIRYEYRDRTSKITLDFENRDEHV
jgi:serine/threonine-protein kinase RsbW